MSLLNTQSIVIGVTLSETQKIQKIEQRICIPAITDLRHTLTKQL